MERDLWRRIVPALRRVPRTRPRNAVFTDREVLAVLLWAALHDRCVSWACRRENWPRQAWRRRLPHQSTMSRRLRRPEIEAKLRMLLDLVQAQRDVEASMLIIDGKPLPISRQSRDPDARRGWADGGYRKGYKLNALIDDRDRVLGWSADPLNHAEPLAARRLVRQAHRAASGRLPPRVPLLGDSAYDTNALHLEASIRGMQLIAPRKKPGMGLGKRRHHASRLRCVAALEARRVAPGLRTLRKQRVRIERFFGAMATVGGGLNSLPPWIRRLHRVRLWVGAKLIINAARIARREANAA